MAKKIIMKRVLKKQKYSEDTLYFHTNTTLDATYTDSVKESIDIARALSEREDYSRG